MVKSPHPIGEIAARISQLHGARVRLMRESTSENGSPATIASEQIARKLNPVEATVAALADPIDFPPLAAGIVPGDRVAIAVDEGIACAGDIVRGAITSLQKAGVECDSISVVSCDAATDQLCRESCSTEESKGVHFVIHDPDDDQNLCLVGVRKCGKPVLINRLIFDADVVLPIGCARINGRGAYECLFPRFSNAEAIRRYRAPKNIEAAKHDSKLRETNEAGWLIGVPMVLEVVPGAGETVAHVLAGEPKAVARQSEALMRGEWLLESPRQASLMVATVTGGPQTQTWTSIGRALAMAEHLVVDGGAVAICSNLSEPPGQSLGRLIGSSDPAEAEHKISHEHEADSWPAWQLARALQRGPVYFLSQLDPETVEDLGLAPVLNVEELARLTAGHESFVVVEDSQNAVVTLAGEANERE